MENIWLKLTNSLMVKVIFFPGVVFGGMIAAMVIGDYPYTLSAIMIIFIAVVIAFMINLRKFVIRPINRLTRYARGIADGEYGIHNLLLQKDEIGQLSAAIHRMEQEIRNKTIELNEKKSEYQDLFELVPCIITVQDQEFKLVGFNRAFSDRFDPKPGDYCYSAYKGRAEKCKNCPVEKTFRDGKSHYSEETGIARDGSQTHWIVKTSPMKNIQGETIAAMEMSLDITPIKHLEDELKRSEEKYYAIFNNIPNPVFLLDMETLEILDCNESITEVYGYQKHEILGSSFLNFFMEKETDSIADRIKNEGELDKVKQVRKDQEFLYVNIRISLSDFFDEKVLLVITSDVTKRLEAQSQLIQAGKMATLGEMATGVAHELNQPLSVIKTASDFIMRKLRKKEVIQEDILLTMAEEMDRHVDRAAGIITHLRQFGRKTDLKLEEVQVNDIMKRAFEIFRQQFTLREIHVEWHLCDILPAVMAEPGRLEQVFVNLLINARDAIDEKRKVLPGGPDEKKVILRSSYKDNTVKVEVIDTGIGVSDNIKGKIFDPFFTTKKVGEGTGIGLSISYGIVADFDGTLQLDPDCREGTCFVVTLPPQHTIQDRR